MQQKIEKNIFISEITSEIFVFEIIVSVLVSLNCLYIKIKILFIDSQCFNRQSQDFACE